MTVDKTSFSKEMNNNEWYDIPFFQRKYVWDTSNWQEILKELLDENKKEHFLGSFITKDEDEREDGKIWKVASYNVFSRHVKLTCESDYEFVALDEALKFKKVNKKQ